MNKIFVGIAAASLASLALTVSAQQPQANPLLKSRIAHQHLNCAAEIAQERDSFQRNMQRGLQNGSINPVEKVALDKTHAELMAMEKKANEDGKLSAQECQAIHSKMVEASGKLKQAMATGGKMAPQQALAHCKAEIAHERTSYVASVKRGLDAGLIDAKERADLEKTHNELTAMEKKAAADGKLSLQECQGIHGKVLEENRKLKLAMGQRPPRGPVQQVAGGQPVAGGHPPARGHRRQIPHKHANCAAEIAQERDSFQRNMMRGLQNGSINQAEKAALDKTHADLLAMEKKAHEDGKLSAQECQAIHGKMIEESSKLKRAMATGGKMAPQQALAHCKAEIAHERTSYVASVKRGLDDGLIDAKERADLEKTHNELAAMEKKAAADGKLSLQECQGIHGKVLEENRKLKLALATRPAAAGK